jgi:tryptophanyl-tRNA synthetase
MSKSLWNTIYLTATEKEIASQVAKMYTDPGKTSIQAKWDISHHVPFQYLDIFYTGDISVIHTLKERYIAWGENSVWDGEIKKLLIQTLETTLRPIREKRELLLKDPSIVQKAILHWSSHARKQGQEILHILKSSMGLLHYGE